LREIFLLWYRNTHASVDEKISVLQMLLGREPDIAWKLLVSLIPSSHNYCSKTHDYRWRQVSPVKTPAVTRMELYVGVDKIIGMLIAYARNDETLWAELIERFHDIPPDRRREIAGKLASSTQALGTGANTLRKKLRRLLSHHRSFPDAGWALPETEMAELAKVYEAIEPLDLTDRFSWLFDFNPELPEGKVGNDFAKHDLELNKRRITAIIEILKDSDIDGLIVLVEKVEDSWVLGICAAQANLNHGQEEKILLLLKEGNSEKAIRFVQGYVCWRGNNAGEEWIDLTIASSLKDSWEPKMITNFLVALPENMATWRKLDSYNASTQEEYWKKCWARFYRGSIEEREFGIKKLLSVDRAYAALDIAGISRDGLPKALLVDILEKTATVEPEPDANISLGASHIARLMNILDKTEDVEEAQKIKLEWIYLQIFASDWCEYSPRRLYTELTKNPAFFADVIKFIYKPKDESANNDAEGLTREAVVSRAQRAYELLSSWKTVPGRSPNGKLSYELLKRWVQEARRLCKEAGRGVSGDHHIGQILAHANVEENGCWPPEAVARVIDESNSKEIESGFHVGIVNMRGVTTRSLDEGGMQERELAAHYRKYSKHFATRYPRTAAILSGVADDYDYRAKDEDNEVKRRDIEY
jgi:hypothetical protein